MLETQLIPSSPPMFFNHAGVFNHADAITAMRSQSRVDAIRKAHGKQVRFRFQHGVIGEIPPAPPMP